MSHRSERAPHRGRQTPSPRRWPSLALAAGVLLLGALPDAGAAVVQSTTTPYPGVTYQVQLESAIPARAHVLIVDLTSSELGLVATAQADRGKSTSAFAAASGAQMAINGDFFSPVDFETAGLAMGGAMVWAGAADDAVNGFFRFDQNGGRTNAAISAPEQEVAASALPAGTQGVIGGRPMLVRSGMAVTSFDCTDSLAMPCERAPRTAIGISQDGNTLWVVVVDGWQAGSLGMTGAELGAFLKSLGAYDALMFDGGGSSAMHIAAEGGLVSSPSDGVQRTVANHLGIRYGTLPPGQMRGFVRERDILDATANISGATVVLDDGQTRVTGADGAYFFDAISPRYACATASAPGYRTVTSCRQVKSQELVYNSIAMFPHSDFVDAGPGAPDAGPTGPDAGPTPDAAPPTDGSVGVDAGDEPPGDGCSCAADPRAAAPIVLALFLAPLLLRRRP